MRRARRSSGIAAILAQLVDAGAARAEAGAGLGDHARCTGRRSARAGSAPGRLRRGAGRVSAHARAAGRDAGDSAHPDERRDAGDRASRSAIIGCTPEVVREWRSVGAVIQMDAVMVFGSAPDVAAWRDSCSRRDSIDSSRATRTATRARSRMARDWLEGIDAHEQAELLCTVNARRLLDREAVLPVIADSRDATRACSRSCARCS